MQTVRSSAGPRLCHPAGVRALSGPVSGGVATHRLPSCDASGISCRFPEGTQRVATRHLGRLLEGTQVLAGRWRSRDIPARLRWETARNF